MIVVLVLILDIRGQWDRKIGGRVPKSIGWTNEEGIVEESGSLYEVEYERIVIDEGHNLKNFRTIKSLFALSLNAEHRWVSSFSRFYFSFDAGIYRC